MDGARVAKFEKVSWSQFFGDCIDCIWGDSYDYKTETEQREIEDLIRGWYDGIRLPERATVGSAGYDFFLPMDVSLEPGEEVKFPTGIRCIMNYGTFLAMVPRSGIGFKHGIRLSNTIGIIDCDYSESSNEGHIWAKLINDKPNAKQVLLKQGTAFVQGILLPFGMTHDDHVTSLRDGGFGSTDGKSDDTNS